MNTTLKTFQQRRTKRKYSNKKKMSDIFKDQIAEDISRIQKDWGYLDNQLGKKEYAFNYWVLSRLYDIDEELIPELITEYNDKSIDCYVNYEDDKKLYLIQCKYYDENTPLARNAVTDFLNTPLVVLDSGNYKKSRDLQRIFDKAKDDPEYEIYLHFYLSNNKRNLDSDTAIKNFNSTPPIKTKGLLRSQMFYLEDISDLYFGKSFKQDISFKYKLQTKVRGNILKILPEEYELPDMSRAYYLLTPVYQLYSMYKSSISKKYPLFEENIREYLGPNPINKGIINTLKDKSDRSNFFYYNNGITIICSQIDPAGGNSIELVQPQIVNGCQTVNSIYEVLSDYGEDQIREEFKQTFVMVKVLLFDSKTRSLKPNFYRDIVKFTNKQNSINENAFGARKDIFGTLQREFKERGFLLLVKPSDKNIFSKTYSSDAETNNLLNKANEYTDKIGLQFKKLSDVFIPLDKLLQVFLSFAKDGFYAYTKKNVVLKQTSEIYRDYSLRISDHLNHDNLIRLFLIYLKSEQNRNKDNKTPIPLYVISFLGHFIKNRSKSNAALQQLFDPKKTLFPSLLQYLEKLTTQYKKEYIEKLGSDYNTMIKKPIDEEILSKQIDTLNDLILTPELKAYFESLY